jgi:TolB-like protein
MSLAVRLGVAVVTLLWLGGCEQPYIGAASSSVTAGSGPLVGGDLGERTYRAVDRMLDADPALMTSGASLVVGSIADIQDVNRATPFGNIIAELIRTRLVQRGVPVTELRLRSSVLLDRTQGELMLARDRRALVPAPSATHIVTGTYAVASGKVYVSLKIISNSDARITCAADFSVPRYGDADALLVGSPTAYR